jgi:murein DD-endopeptidase MepM/ murein hydrolase activator NlpD
MGFYNRTAYLLLFFLCFFLPFSVHAQNEGEENEFNIYESVNDSIDLRSNFYDTFDSLSLFFPASEMYENWDNDYLYYPKVDFTKKEDTTRVILCDEKTSFFCMPRIDRINSEYGYRHRRFHYGIDINLNIGDTVRSAFDGMVRVSKYYKGYGNVVVVRHFNGIETTYAHLSVARVLENQIIRAGDVLGFGGSTGRSTGPHVHFETRYLGTPFNPRKIIDFENKKLISDTLLVSKYLFQNRTVYKTTTTQVSQNKTTTTTTTTPQKGNSSYYTVKSGDTLSRIAVNYHTTVTTLCKLNGLTTKSILRIGQKIKVK